MSTGTIPFISYNKYIDRESVESQLMQFVLQNLLLIVYAFGFCACTFAVNTLTAHLSLNLILKMYH